RIKVRAGRRSDELPAKGTGPEPRTLRTAPLVFFPKEFCSSERKHNSDKRKKTNGGSVADREGRADCRSQTGIPGRLAKGSWIAHRPHDGGGRVDLCADTRPLPRRPRSRGGLSASWAGILRSFSRNRCVDLVWRPALGHARYLVGKTQIKVGVSSRAFFPRRRPRHMKRCVQRIGEVA